MGVQEAIIAGGAQVYAATIGRADRLALRRSSSLLRATLSPLPLTSRSGGKRDEKAGNSESRDGPISHLSTTFDERVTPPCFTSGAVLGDPASSFRTVRPPARAPYLEQFDHGRPTGQRRQRAAGRRAAEQSEILGPRPIYKGHVVRESERAAARSHGQQAAPNINVQINVNARQLAPPTTK